MMALSVDLDRGVVLAFGNSDQLGVQIRELNHFSFLPNYSVHISIFRMNHQ